MNIARFEVREWIDPWRDRRPMTEDRVLVALGDAEDFIGIARYVADPIDEGWYIEMYGHNTVNILAWMPLPEPYNPVEEEEE